MLHIDPLEAFATIGAIIVFLWGVVTALALLSPKKTLGHDLLAVVMVAVAIGAPALVFGQVVGH